MKLKIGDILQDQQGRLHDFQLEEHYEFSKDYTVDGPISMDVTLLRDEDGIICMVHRMDAKVLLPCEFCDQQLPKEIRLEKAFERRFALEKPNEHTEETVEEQFLIDTHKHTIDLTEMIRQELELRIPFHHACVITNGQCSTCGKALLEEGPQEPIAQDTYNPFAGLKDIFPTKENN